MAATQTGGRSSAAELLRIGWELDPDNFEILLRLGICCYNLDYPSSALAMFRRAASLRPDSDRVHYFLGNCYTSLVNAPEALRAYQRAIQLAPNNAVYHYRLRKVLFRERRMEEALAAYKFGLSLSPDDAATHSALGRVYRRLKQEDLAVSEFREAIRLNLGLPNFTIIFRSIMRGRFMPTRQQSFRRHFKEKQQSPSGCRVISLTSELKNKVQSNRGSRRVLARGLHLRSDLIQNEA